MKKLLSLILLLFLFATTLNGGYLGNKAKKGILSKTTSSLLKKKTTQKVAKDISSKTKDLVVKKVPLVPTKHSVQQKINRNVTTKDELDAIKRPLEIKPIKVDNQGRESQRYIGEKSEVAINPLLGKIVSVNPTSTKKANKLKANKND
ncbi:hypothetical protein [Aliarcobacter butzleri]|uniref:hypothetical protein n=1 Tax=Aliarcobacter butzleri TaxID=28197 RepID=UPI001269EA35|nr:hypothetical protein [Aliarcobacter butzleri]